MTRNFLKTAETGERITKSNNKIELCVDELQVIYDMIRKATSLHDGIFNASAVLFHAGIAVGSNYEKQRARKARKTTGK